MIDVTLITVMAFLILMSLMAIAVTIKIVVWMIKEARYVRNKEKNRS